ncbi:MAG: hypothetical protein ACE5G0_21925 [Rhodothermales bacterium]
MQVEPQRVSAARQVLEALFDRRVLRALEVALRDAAIRRRFRALRREGRTVEEACYRIGEEVHLSEHSIRRIVYDRAGQPV